MLVTLDTWKWSVVGAEVGLPIPNGHIPCAVLCPHNGDLRMQKLECVDTCAGSQLGKSFSDALVSSEKIQTMTRVSI